MAVAVSDTLAVGEAHAGKQHQNHSSPLCSRGRRCLLEGIPGVADGRLLVLGHGQLLNNVDFTLVDPPAIVKSRCRNTIV